MQIHGMCLVKNEADIVEEGLRAARAWCDAIYVLDNGSTDGTWEIVLRLAAEDPAIIAWKREEAPFHDGLRASIYHQFADRSAPGDWWVRLDPDEFYVDEPRAFLEKVPSTKSFVWYASLSFYFSTEEARRYREDPSQFADGVPVMEKCRYYFNHWSEVRFVRHEAMSPWSGVDGWPEALLTTGRAYETRIVCRHFPYRSPHQIEQRIATRAASALDGDTFGHEAIANWSAVVDPAAVREHRWENVEYVTDLAEMDRGWESRVINAESLVFDAHDGHFELNEDLMPSIGGRPANRLLSNRVTRYLRRRLR